MSAPLAKLLVPLPPILARLELEGAVQTLLEPAATAADALTLLVGEGLHHEAVKLVAHALPKREAVWWGCMCVDATRPDPLPDWDTLARRAAEAWVRSPGDDGLRRAAGDAAQRTQFQTAEAWVAMGAFWSSGSMAPEGAPAVPAGETFTALAISGAVVLAAVRFRPGEAKARLERFLTSARDIAAGGAGRLEREAT